MIDIEYEQYDFKKAMQTNVDKEFAVLLKNNQFVKYKKNKFAREKDQIVQIITFSIGKNIMKVFAMFIPIYVSTDISLEYGIEVTGSDGYRLLNGKYFTTVYEPEMLNKEIQYKNYCEKHKVSLQKIYSAIEEGIIPEMDEIDSLEKFIERLNDQDFWFFNSIEIGQRKSLIYEYVMGVYECINNDFANGMNRLKKIQAIDWRWWDLLKKYETESVDEFMKSYIENCDEMRRYYKFTKMNFQKEVHKPVRDTKQDEIEILKLELTDLQAESDVEQETQTNGTQANEIQTNEKADKFNRVCGKLLFGIAAMLLCINVFCRMVDAVKSMEYVRVMGTVTDVEVTQVGNLAGYVLHYHVNIEYPIQGNNYSGTISALYTSNMFSKGDTVPVLYRKDAVYRAYIAKKDWMTGAYLPVNISYNVLLIISVVLFAIGFILYKDGLNFYAYIKHFTTER